MSGNWNAKDITDRACRHVRTGRRFSANVRQALCDESSRLRGDVECLCCGDWKSRPEFHHIKPWSERGTSETENGAILCPTCHAFADQAIITPLDLSTRKLGTLSIGRLDGRTSTRVEDVIASVPVIEGRDRTAVDEVVRAALEKLGELRCCETGDPALRDEWRRAVGRTQIRLAGALTSREGVEGVPQDARNRYMIAMLARSAASIGRRLHDPLLFVQGLHSLATNANALHRISTSIEYCERIRSLLQSVREAEREYVAYTMRNMSAIYEKGNQQAISDQLVDDSERLSPGIPETLIRRAEVLTMRGDFTEASKYIERHVCMPQEAAFPIRQVIAVRICGMHRCLSGDVPQGLECLERARVMAAASSLGHQEHKIAFAQRALSRKATLQEIAALGQGKARRRLPSHLLQLF
jgi:hypothetical protein